MMFSASPLSMQRYQQFYPPSVPREHILYGKPVLMEVVRTSWILWKGLGDAYESVGHLEACHSGMYVLTAQVAL